MTSHSFIQSNLEAVNTQIGEAAIACHRNPENITLLAVSKTKPVSDIIHAYNCGQRHFGENYAQEGAEKIAIMRDYSDILWHFIGPIQSNKSKLIAENFAWVHSVDRIKIARRLGQQRPTQMPALNVCIQVNIDAEEQKSGVDPELIDELAEAIVELPNIRLRGLMTIPNLDNDEDALSQSFAKMYSHFERLRQAHPSIDTLSMGMSQDIALAISHGSTMVRVGTAIFGKRN